ncbi:acylphosphatase [Polycladidibacter stylochi]|uniref:acylphosphatase n=1 Tax=Polycladidibacter stylochi TaxID=1807766 RepID=UPI0009ECBF9F|nr:acylphosphatase [Pseudovibrio stylochi]
MQAERISISGRVQGVGYRYWFMTQAVRLGLRGWVKNCADGRVEAAIAGPKDACQKMIEAAYVGPRFARVSAIEKLGVINLPEACSQAKDGFQIVG